MTDAPWKDRVLVIAEVGSNWRIGPDRDANYRAALDLIRAAADAGVNAVKFQVFTADRIYAPNAGAADYLSDQRSMAKLLREIELPKEWIPQLAAKCDEYDIDFLASAFSAEEYDLIDPFVRVHKIASYEITDLPLIRHVGKKGKPVVLSTGCATNTHIADAILALGSDEWNSQCDRMPHLSVPVVVMHCVGAYPAPPDQANMAALDRSRVGSMNPIIYTAFGLSDHTSDPITAPVMAIALGARVIEKHFTLGRHLPGPDHAFAVEPDELRRMVEAIRLAEMMLGDGVKRVQPCEEELCRFAQRSLQAARDIAKGEVLKYGDNFAMLRPGKNKRGGDAFEIAKLNGTPAHRSYIVGEGVRCE